MLSWYQHQRDCIAKKRERIRAIASLPVVYHEELTAAEHDILATPLESLAAKVRDQVWTPRDVLLAYSKKALEAHQETNCLTEILIPDAERFIESLSPGFLGDRPLAGVPVSLKDTVNVKGYDSCIGYSAWTFRPAENDSVLTKLLRDAGAVPFVKTNVPVTLLSFKSANDVWGCTTNPYSKLYSPGGSSGGESALLAFGGSIIGVGTDVAGSVRVPAHFAGIYAIRCSTGRFPRAGNVSSLPGQEGVKAVYSPMARSLDSLRYFLKAVIDMKPWVYDASCEPIPWREAELPAKVRFGVMRTDGVVRPSPACARALELCLFALLKDGHEVVPFELPEPAYALELAGQLLLADGGRIATAPYRWGEHGEAGLNVLLRAFALPRWCKWLWSRWQTLCGDGLFARLISTWHAKSVSELQGLVARREAYRQACFEAWSAAGIDVLLTVPNPTPAVPHDASWGTAVACGYTVIFNLLDYAAGVFPVTRVEAERDALPPGFRPANALERGAFRHYDAAAMAGLPVGVQLAARRLEEERVLSAIGLVERALHRADICFVGAAAAV